jgi:hypothetical protein
LREIIITFSILLSITSGGRLKTPGRKIEVGANCESRSGRLQYARAGPSYFNYGARGEREKPVITQGTPTAAPTVVHSIK